MPTEADGQQQAQQQQQTTPPEQQAQQQAAQAQRPAGQQEGRTFSQADVDRIVQDRLQQQARNQFGDYDTLRTKAGESTALEQRLGKLEADLTASQTQALRASVAAEYGISTKPGENGAPSDADLFLTGTTADALKAQAERLAGRETARQVRGNVARQEGGTTITGKPKTEMREFTAQLFGNN